jgi:DNA-binding GntR family transcriptional regulator
MAAFIPSMSPASFTDTDLSKPIELQVVDALAVRLGEARYAKARAMLNAEDAGTVSDDERRAFWADFDMCVSSLRR